MIIRTPDRHRYTIISKVPLEDARLSWKARGLLCYLLSKPDNWNVVVSHLIKEAPDGRDSVLAGLRELESAGYIVRSKMRGSVGQFDGLETEVFEEPSGNGLSGNGLSVAGKPATNEEGLLKINDYKESSSKSEKYSDEFDSLWKVYPRKSNKQGAYKKFLSTIKHCDVSFDELMVAVENYALLQKDNDEKYVLHGATFFGPDQRWRDFLGGVVEPGATYDPIVCNIYDQWDSLGMWVSPTTNEKMFSNPFSAGYIRPQASENVFVASDMSLYVFDQSGRRVSAV